MEFPLGFGLYKTGLPLILTSGKLKNVCFLIDTGSTHNFIFSFVYEHFIDEFHTLKETQKTMGIEGNFRSARPLKQPSILKVQNILRHLPLWMRLEQCSKFRRRQTYKYMACLASNFCWKTNGVLILRNELFLVHNALLVKHSTPEYICNKATQNFPLSRNQHVMKVQSPFL